MVDGDKMETMSAHCCRLLCHGSRIPVSKTAAIYHFNLTSKDQCMWAESYTAATVSASQELVICTDYAKKHEVDRQGGHHFRKLSSFAAGHSSFSNRASSSATQNSCSVTDVDDDIFMRLALVEAQNGASVGEVPVGAVLVQNRAVIAAAHNRVETDHDPTAHAEMLCIRTAAAQVAAWRLNDCTLYVTLEPCAMCAGAVLQARVGRVVWGAPNTLLGADGSWVRLFPTRGDGVGDSGEECDCSIGPIHPFHPHLKVRRGVLGEECAKLIRDFFRARRRDTDMNPTEFKLLADATFKG